jgi:hypothetical protein
MADRPCRGRTGTIPGMALHDFISFIRMTAALLWR